MRTLEGALDELRTRYFHKAVSVQHSAFSRTPPVPLAPFGLTCVCLKAESRVLNAECFSSLRRVGLGLPGDRGRASLGHAARHLAYARDARLCVRHRHDGLLKV